MIRLIKSLFAWRDVNIEGKWLYQENAITGRRRAVSLSGGYSPLDFDWLDEGSLDRGHPTVDGIPAWRTAQGMRDGRWCF